MRTDICYFVITLLSLCSVAQAVLCGDGTTAFTTHEIRPSKKVYPHIVQVSDTTPRKWLILTDPGKNLSISLNRTNTLLSGPSCNSTQPYGVSTLLIRTFFSPSSHYDVRICPGLYDGRSYVSTNRIEIFHCSPIKGDRFMFQITKMIGGTRRAMPSERTINVDKNKTEQWITLETGRDGIILNLTKIKVRVGANRQCKAGFIKVLDPNTQNSVLPDGLDIVCNKSDGKIKTNYLVLSQQQAVKVVFKNAKFTMTYRSASTLVISQMQATTAAPGAATTIQMSATESQPKEPRNNVPQAEGGVTDDGQSDQSGGSVGLFEAIGLGCAAVVVLIAIVVGYITLRKRRRNSQRRMSSKPNDEDPPVYMERPSQQSSDGVRSIDNLMYEKIVKGNGGNRSRAPTAAYAETPKTRDPLLNNRTQQSNCSRSETEKRRQRLSQLEDVYLGLEHNKPNEKPKAGNFPLPPDGEVPVTPLFHNDRPPLPPPEPETPHRYEIIQENEDEEIPSVSYATVTKPNKNTRQSAPPCGSDSFVRPPVALYVSSDELLQGTPNISLTPSEECLGQRKMSLPPVDKDGYLSLTSQENLDMPIDDVDRHDERSYVQVNSVSQEDVRKHFADRKRMATPGIDKSSATSMPELVHKKRQVTRPGFPVAKQQSDRLRLPQSSQANKHYRQPRPSAPDIFIQSAYTSGEDLSQIRAHLERVAAQARAQNNGSHPDRSEKWSGTDESSSSRYDSPRPSIGSSQDSLLDGRRPNFYDAPRPSLPCIFPDDLRRIVDSTENLRKL